MTGRERKSSGIAHGVIRFDKSLEEYGAVRRRVEISKMRGVPIADGYHDMAIREGEGRRRLPEHIGGRGRGPLEAASHQIGCRNARRDVRRRAGSRDDARS